MFGIPSSQPGSSTQSLKSLTWLKRGVLKLPSLPPAYGPAPNSTCFQNTYSEPYPPTSTKLSICTRKHTHLHHTNTPTNLRPHAHYHSRSNILRASGLGVADHTLSVLEVQMISGELPLKISHPTIMFCVQISLHYSNTGPLELQD